MTPAVLSLIALLVAIVLSCTSRINVGVLSIAFAWLIGVYRAGMKADAVAAGFPASLFVTLAGVTLLFGLAHVNGTLEWMAQRAVRLARGNARLIPIFFFVIALVLSAVGPGAVLGVALLIPLAMPIGVQAGVPRLLTALMVANGANAGNLSPVSVIGLIANTKMAEAGIGGHEWAVFAANVVAHVIVGVAAYVFFGGRHLSKEAKPGDTPLTALTRAQMITTGVVLVWIAAVIIFKLNVGMAAFAAASILVLLKVADEVAAIKQIPWGVIIMVCGVTMLIAVLEKTGGMDLFSAMIATIARPSTINGTLAFVTGLISSWSSTSGVVLPAFLPTVPSLVANVGGGDPVAVAISINIGSALVDVSPLSTLGALCVATVSDPVEARVLFRQLLVWGLSMTIVGAIIAQLMAGFFARA
ncbi:MAG TPA: SLC13 family permease [Vicinamibacterales bacterium]|nr:SLC13 family permease [Vicinamibacterales bacterium]